MNLARISASLNRLLRRTSSPALRSSGRGNILSNDAMIFVGGMSRSGTTLLTTVLDAHPDIAFGAELLPSPFSSLPAAIASLDRAMLQTNGDFSRVGQHLRSQGERDLGLFFLRCHRAGATAEETRETLVEMKNRFSGGITTFPARLSAAQTILCKRAKRERALRYGFKFTSAAADVAHDCFPNSQLLCIVRDPFDVVLSHQKRNFDRSTDDICKMWNTYARSYREYADLHPDRSQVVRYEDLVRQPRRTLRNVFEGLKLDLHPDVFEFHRSNSPIHAGFHPNAARLRMNFSADGVGRGRTQLPTEVVRKIEAQCKDEMEAYGYDNPGHIRRRRRDESNGIIRIDQRERAQRQRQFSSKRKFNQDDYEALLAPYLDTYEIMPIGDYVREDEIGDRKILMIRHDVDHDLETAMKIAAWERARGLRSTYCLLHTAWYYGQLENGRYRHSDFLIEGITKLRELGHEINFHNNLIALALREGVAPMDLLESELAFYDRLGVSVTGTSTHGDGLCRELGFRNWELFAECCDDRFGGPREIAYQAPTGRVHTCRVGVKSMLDFGLEYEAYDMTKDVYHTESGGTLRTRTNTSGRRPFGRSDSSRGSVVGVLTHPVWWTF